MWLAMAAQQQGQCRQKLTIRDDSVADSKDPEELLDDGRAGLLEPSIPHDALVIEVEAGLLPGHCCRILYHIYDLPSPVPCSKPLTMQLLRYSCGIEAVFRPDSSALYSSHQPCMTGGGTLAWSAAICHLQHGRGVWHRQTFATVQKASVAGKSCTLLPCAEQCHQ